MAGSAVDPPSSAGSRVGSKVLSGPGASAPDLLGLEILRDEAGCALQNN